MFQAIFLQDISFAIINKRQLSVAIFKYWLMELPTSISCVL
jgi:hypothetical protein